MEQLHLLLDRRRLRRAVRRTRARGPAAQPDQALRPLQADDRVDAARRRAARTTCATWRCAISTSPAPTRSGRSGQSTPERHAPDQGRGPDGARRRGPIIEVFGTDYPTPDGTCLRDYIQVTRSRRRASRGARPSAPRRRQPDPELRLRPRLLGAGGDRRREAGLRRRLRGPPRRRAGPAIRPRSSPRPTASASELGWRPRYDDLDGIVASGARLGAGAQDSEPALRRPVNGSLNHIVVALTRPRSAMPFERGADATVILLVWTCCAALLPAAGAAAQRTCRSVATSSAEDRSQGARHEARSAVAGVPRLLETLWPKAQARGVSRATFDLAFQGVDARPEGRRARPGAVRVRPADLGLSRRRGLGRRIRRGAELARQWAATLDAVEAFYGVPRSVVLGGLGHGDATSAASRARPPSSGRSRPSRFTASAPATSERELHRRAGDDREGPYPPCGDARLLGRRHGPDPVHAVELPRLRGRRRRRRPPRHLGFRPRRPRLDRELPEGARLEAGAALGLRGRPARGLRLRGHTAAASPSGRPPASSAWTAPRCRAPARACSSCPPAPAARPSCLPRTSSSSRPTTRPTPTPSPSATSATGSSAGGPSGAPGRRPRRCSA